MTETQQRFLRSIAQRVPMEQVVEVHLFPPIRQGGVETGVAVVAEDPRRSSAAPVVASEGEDTTDHEAESVEPEPQADGDGIAADEIPAPAAARFTIHTARYRLTLKGVDRGKWEVDVVAEADAPLDALDKVVRGVQRRAGEGAEPDRLTSDAFREALDAPLASLER